VCIDDGAALANAAKPITIAVSRRQGLFRASRSVPAVGAESGCCLPPPEFSRKQWCSKKSSEAVVLWWVARRPLSARLAACRPSLEARLTEAGGRAGRDASGCYNRDTALGRCRPRRAPASMARHSTSWPAGRVRLFGIDSHSRNSSRSWPSSSSSKRGPGVVYHVVVDELDVAGREAHLETQLFGKFGEEVEPFAIGCC